MEASATEAAIVAGGRARRFQGRDKSRLVVEGRPIIVRQLQVLQQVVSRVTLVGSDVDRFADLGLPVLPDRLPDNGALGGIYTAVAAAQAPRVIVVACDLPFLDAGLLRRLVDVSQGHDGAWVATARGVEPLLACYARHTADRMLTMIEAGQLKAADLSRTLDMAILGHEEVARFGPVDRLLANVNTPDDYARVQYPPS
jgi:molybdopterin-guanine dinucleotide biosynthesis protein A